MSNINSFPIDDNLKRTITGIVAHAAERAGEDEWNANRRKWFTDNCAEEIIENVLEAINIWSTTKLQ